MTELLHLIAGMPHGAAIIDNDGIVQAINGRCAALCQVAETDFRPLPLVDFLSQVVADGHPWRGVPPWDVLRRELSAGVTVRLEGAGESETVLRLMCEGEEPCVLILAGDISDDFAVARDLDRRSRALVDAFLGYTDCAAVVVDAAGTVFDHNDLATQIARSSGSGDDVPRLIGTPVDQCLPLLQVGRPFELLPLIQRAQERRRELSFAADIQLERFDGSRQDVAVSIVPVLTPQNQSEPAAVVFVRDAGEDRQVRRDLREIQHAREISRAAVGIAHELNNSATALMAQLNLLERDRAGGVAASADLRNAQSAVRRIRRLGLQLERFSGTDPEPVEREDSVGGASMSATLLSETIQDTVGLAVSGTGIRTSFAIESGLPAVRVTAGALSQALFNVVMNAVEAMDEEGLLHLEVQHQVKDGVVEVAVRDEGHGMDPRLLTKVMQPYFSTKPKGIGMGLTVALSTLESFGGTVRIETEPGFGTTVQLEIPVTGVHREAGNTPPVQMERFNDTRVLLVEDDPLVRRSLERTLEAVGCSVTAVENGDRAIDIFQREIEDGRRYQLVITDLTMPGRNDGVQLLRRVRELDPDVPAVLSSGALHRQNSSSYRDAGFQFVLRKPFGEPEVRYALSVALAHAQ